MVLRVLPLVALLSSIAASAGASRIFGHGHHLRHTAPIALNASNDAANATAKPQVKTKQPSFVAVRASPDEQKGEGKVSKAGKDAGTPNESTPPIIRSILRASLTTPAPTKTIPSASMSEEVEKREVPAHAPEHAPEHEKGGGKCFGLSRPKCALTLGLLSGISLPVGAAMGIFLHPVKEEIVSSLLAIGGGSLLFAVTVELYGHALHELQNGRMAFWTEFIFIIAGAIVGSAFYTYANEWLESRIKGEDEEREEAKTEVLPPMPMEVSEEEEEVEEVQEEPASARGKLQLPAPVRASVSPGMMRSISPRARSADGSPCVRSSVRRVSRTSTIAALQTPTGAVDPRVRAKQLWWKLRITVLFGGWARMELKKTMKNRDRALLQCCKSGAAPDEALAKAMFTSAKDMTPKDKREVAHAKALAMSLFLGLVIDGVPECMLMGFLAAEDRLTMVLVISLIVANYPEAFSSASLLKRARISNGAIVGLWTGLMLGVGIFCGITCYVLLLAFPDYGRGGAKLPLPILIFTSFVEGVAGGAMITLIAAVILPEAMEKASKTGPIYHRSGFCCALGFLLSVGLKVIFEQGQH